MKKADFRTFGEQRSVKSHGGDIFHPRFRTELSKIIKMQNIDIFYVSSEATDQI